MSGDYDRYISGAVIPVVATAAAERLRRRIIDVVGSVIETNSIRMAGNLLHCQLKNLPPELNNPECMAEIAHLLFDFIQGSFPTRKRPIPFILNVLHKPTDSDHTTTVLGYAPIYQLERHIEVDTRDGDRVTETHNQELRLQFGPVFREAAKASDARDSLVNNVLDTSIVQIPLTAFSGFLESVYLKLKSVEDDLITVDEQEEQRERERAEERRRVEEEEERAWRDDLPEDIETSDDEGPLGSPTAKERERARERVERPKVRKRRRLVKRGTKRRPPSEPEAEAEAEAEAEREREGEREEVQVDGAGDTPVEGEGEREREAPPASGPEGDEGEREGERVGERVAESVSDEESRDLI
ncbi:hypothetical protein KIPB_002529 [Kipferlia bialata]|uniref:Uncharacterized protein n=1 Tax=Kipferlia bialata TaxID=797122 RepID=A0A9K3GG26_9EUKA|nr:hypothetical protein KIPB_002529 [Kipferlia bialata]|eukprot:g2529.t1